MKNVPNGAETISMESSLSQRLKLMIGPREARRRGLNKQKTLYGVFVTPTVETSDSVENDKARSRIENE